MLLPMYRSRGILENQLEMNLLEFKRSEAEDHKFNHIIARTNISLKLICLQLSSLNVLRTQAFKINVALVPGGGKHREH